MEKNKLKPFIKWAGGKTQLLDIILQSIPREFHYYYEPFLGGGSVVFALQPEVACISDLNRDLINCYIAIKREPQELIDRINDLDKFNTDREFYLKIRQKYNEIILGNEICNIEKASYFIWLNKHCFNGLYRVNKKGMFNVSWNGKENIKSVDEDNLRLISRYLNDNNVVLNYTDFQNVLSSAIEKDFIYLDPPYIPESDTANFTTYQAEGFDYNDHIRLVNVYKELTEKGCFVMLSNNDVELARELYKDYRIISIDTKRNINRKGNNRKGKEILVLNY